MIAALKPVKSYGITFRRAPDFLVESLLLVDAKDRIATAMAEEDGYAPLERRRSNEMLVP